MSEEITKEIEDFISALSTEIDIWNYIEIDEIDLDNPFDSIINAITNEGVFYIAGEITYYDTAIDYLRLNDNSLQESLAIAYGLGYSPRDLNSEILATLLNSQNIQNDFYDLKDSIEKFFDEIRLKIEQGESEDDDED